ncbi:hypothetical protein [Caulobacter sp. 17J65-9]|uniref:hypothetical protein n=1 Tax=Caulobacter sp. 17J65-9 TaxID=2709382 RepID=UPI0013C814F7|nr:hypothetical protein [Caulobacter sp. 17J65-9]NEX91686.1 hypothetical protein [Caulobacter sp. 17J65-9]
MDKIEVCNKVADKLFATEHAVDEAMVRASQFLESMVEARRELNLSAVAGEVATTRTAETIAALAEARRAVMSAHAALQNLQRKIGVDDELITHAMGKGTNEGDVVGMTAAPGLRIAASQ